MAKILIVLTAAAADSSLGALAPPVGFTAKEFVVPYHIFLEHGLEVTIATPRGRPAMLDPDSFDLKCHGGDAGRVLNLKEQLAEIEGWQSPASLDRLALATTDYRAVFFPGGYGAMIDLFNHAATGNMVKRILASNGLVGAVGHGQAALLTALHDEAWLFSGYQMTCFSPDEEIQAGLGSALEWNLAQRLQAAGAILSYASPGQEQVVIDRQLYTAQNAASVARLAWEMARKLKKLSALDKASCGTPCD